MRQDSTESFKPMTVQPSPPACYRNSAAPLQNLRRGASCLLARLGAGDGRFQGSAFSGGCDPMGGTSVLPLRGHNRYRDVEMMLAEPGVDVDYSTIYRWVQRYAPEMEKRLRWYRKRPVSWFSWRVDESYIKLKWRWTYLYPAVEKSGATIDFYLSPTRNAKAAKRFLSKALTGLKDW